VRLRSVFMASTMKTGVYDDNYDDDEDDDDDDLQSHLSYALPSPP